MIYHLLKKSFGKVHFTENLLYGGDTFYLLRNKINFRCFWRLFGSTSRISSKIRTTGLVYVEPNKKVSLGTIWKKGGFFALLNVFFLKSHLVYVENACSENNKEVIATLSSDIVLYTISTIRERNQIEIDKKKNEERKEIMEFLKQSHAQNSLVLTNEPQ